MIAIGLALALAGCGATPKDGEVMADGVRLQPVALRTDLRQAMIFEGVRKVDAWTGRHKVADVDFGTEPVDPFFNANRPEDLDEAQRALAAGA